MNVLNKGRCSRCLACEKRTITVKSKNKIGLIVEKIKYRNFCTYNDKWCRGISSHCKESSMGVSVKDYEKRTLKSEEIK